MQCNSSFLCCDSCGFFTGGIVFATSSRTGARLLVLGNSVAETEERAYAFASSLVQELERLECKEIRVGIGDIVDRPESIFNSFKAARHIRHLIVERKDERSIILGVREMGDVDGDKKESSIISDAKLFMLDNFSNPNLMLQDVAREVNMSNSRFSTVFSQQSGQTFTEYLVYLRLNKAKELLRTTDVKASQIASEVGYNDSHYFSYIFKKNVGITPTDFRNQYQNQPE